MDPIGEVSKQLYYENREEYGRLIRLFIGLSAGAITIVSTVLDNPSNSSWLVISSLLLHFVSLGFGLGAQFYLVRLPARELEEIGDIAYHKPWELDEYREFPWPHVLFLIKRNSQPRWLLPCQIGTFVVAAVFLALHFMLQT